MPPGPYQRIIVTGIPMWKDADGRYYYYESSTPPTAENRILIGTETTGLSADWKESLEAKLEAYRTTTQSRARATKS